jgi:hypothetical protein
MPQDLTSCTVLLARINFSELYFIGRLTGDRGVCALQV